MEGTTSKLVSAWSVTSDTEAVSERRQTESRVDKKVTYFTVPTALLIILTSVGGLFFNEVYSGGTGLMDAQASAQHWVHLVVVAPMLIVAVLLMRSGNRAAIFIWLGTMLYTLYSFAIYGFTVRPGMLLIGYCTVLALSLYGTLTVVAATDGNRLAGRFKDGRSNNLIMAYLWIVVLFFSSQWLKQIIPQTFSSGGAGPTGEASPFSTAIHVLDLSIVLPGMGIAAILMRKRRPLGFLLVPSLVVFTVMTNIAYTAMIVNAGASDLPVRIDSAWIFAGIGAFGTAVFIDFVRHKRRPAALEV